MSLKEAIIEMPVSGNCQIDVGKVVKLWHKKCFISRWHDEYTLVEADGVKISIAGCTGVFGNL